MNQTRHDFEALTIAYADAVLAKEPSRLAAIYAPDVRVFDSWERWSYDDLAAWRPTLDEWLGSLGDESVQVSFEDVRASAGGEMGFLNAIVTYTALDSAGNTLRSLQERLTWVLTRKDDCWTIVHQHSSAPISFADKKAIVRRD
jgi:ketosteroid isomerase-like protein